MPLKTRFALTALSLTALLGSSAWGASGAASPATLRPLVERGMATGLSPGLGIAVVQDSRILWVAGFGTADLRTGRPVRPETRFYIGSTTKALTALAAVRLAARGRLALDAPLSQALAGATFPRGYAADSVHVIDLLTHTHGIGDGPVSLRVAYTGDYTPDVLLRVLGAHSLAPSRAFQYSNLGYDLIGVLLAPGKRGGWKEIVEREVTRPLGMRATTAYRSRVRDRQLAFPHQMGSGGFEPIRLAKADSNMGPAGGHFSTPGDLARLLLAELNQGRVDGRQVIEPGVVLETQRLHAAQDRTFAMFHRFGWGIGWDLGTYEEDTLVHRFGTFPGYRSHVSFMPARRLGVVVLSNGGSAGSLLCDAVAAALYDRLLGRPDAEQRLARNLEAIERRAAESRRAAAEERAKRAQRGQDLPHPLTAYEGSYVNPELGTLTLRRGQQGLEAVMGVASSPAEVFDAAQEQLRVELFGGGDVVTMIFAAGEPRARVARLLDREFVREAAGPAEQGGGARPRDR